MPRYKTRGSATKAREKKRIRAQIPRDKRKLRHWAVRGSASDYERLRNAATKHGATKPSYVSHQALQVLQTADRSSMIQATQEKENHWFLDGLAWLIDKVPMGGWVKTLGQAALKPFRGDSMSEVDEQYARLLDEAYKEERDPSFEHWQHQAEFDSDYITVYDNQDGHRYVAVRGTKPKWADVKQDVQIGLTGSASNLIGEDLRRVLDHTEPGRHVDVGGHSLGTNLILTAYDHDDSLQDRVHQTYLYNPTYTPTPFVSNVTSKFEKDERVRYFIDLLDPVSVGQLGKMGPSNVVYRSGFKELGPMGTHKLMQWGGATGMHEHDSKPQETLSKRPQLPYDTIGDGVPNDPEPAQLGVAQDDGFVLDFGDNYSDAWQIKWDSANAGT